MARKARIHGFSQVYHVIMKGINRQIIFESYYDYVEFLNILQTYKDTYKFEIYAYCLMSNHVHLLVKEGNEPLSDTLRRINTKYAMWFNKKYDREGYLFQERFKSEPVDKEDYLKTLLQYIHQNPVKAGIVSKVSLYRWSSFHAYDKHPTPLVDSAQIEFLFDSKEELLKHINTLSKTQCMEYYSSNRIPDDEAMLLIKEKCNITEPTVISSMDSFHRDKLIEELLDLGLSVRQINRLTGVSRRIIDKLSLSVDRRDTP